MNPAVRSALDAALQFCPADPDPLPTGPVALGGLIRRLLEDHQRVSSHHAELCPLCRDTATVLELLDAEVSS